LRFWNFGGEGRSHRRLATAACCSISAAKMPNALLIALMIVIQHRRGSIWALIPAFFKARWNSNETHFTS
jgi:simple sugar transport system permease protein